MKAKLPFPQRRGRAKILLYDLETSPLITYAWRIWDADAIEVIEDMQILCFAYKWLDQKKIHVVSQDDMPGYTPGVNDDKEVVKVLRDLFDEADIVLAHNGCAYDQKVSQARMMVHNLLPPTPYKQIDTKKVAKQYGRFTSNKLDFLNKTFGFEGKIDTGGFATWKGCLAGEKKSWRRMKKYNKKDVEELEKLYLHLRPWIENHPSRAVLEKRPDACPKCGSDKMNAGMKYKATNTNLYQYFRCMECGGMAKARIPEYKQAQEKVKYV